MKSSTFIMLWLAIPLAWALWQTHRHRRVIKMREHDRILFTFCEARDTIALKAIRGEVREDDELFDFFYVRTAKLIHHHKQFGVCFKEIAQAIAAGGYKGELSSSAKRLMRQVKHGDDEIKAMAKNYSDAVLIMLAENSGSILLRALLHISRAAVAESVGKLNKFVRAVARFFIPREELDTLRFARQIVHAANAKDSARDIGRRLAPA